jgi:hypothetical protein
MSLFSIVVGALAIIVLGLIILFQAARKSPWQLFLLFSGSLSSAAFLNPAVPDESSYFLFFAFL